MYNSVDLQPIAEFTNQEYQKEKSYIVESKITVDTSNNRKIASSNTSPMKLPYTHYKGFEQKDKSLRNFTTIADSKCNTATPKRNIVSF